MGIFACFTMESYQRPSNVMLSKVSKLRAEHEENLAIIEKMYYTRKEELDRDVQLWESAPPEPRAAWGESDEYGWRLEATEDLSGLDAGPSDPDPFASTYKPEPQCYVPTTPVPFSFDRTDQKNKPETIVQRRAREEREVRAKLEEEEMKQGFRAQLAPVDSKLLVMEEMATAAEIRRELNKEQYYHRLQHQEFKLTKPKPKAKPPAPQTPKFKATDPPTSTKNWQHTKKQYEDKEKRRRSMSAQRGVKLYMEAQLPPRMEMDKQQRECEPEEEVWRYDHDECTFRPQINPDVPDFDYLHQQFAEQLMDAKASKVPTDPETFNLLTSKMKDTIPDVLEDIARDNIILKENRWPYVSTRAPVPPSEKSFRLKNRGPLYPEALSSSSKKQPARAKSAGPRRRDTAKTRAMQEAIKKKQEDKAMQDAIKKKKESDIKKRQKEVNRRMQPALRATCRRNDDEARSVQARKQNRERSAAAKRAHADLMAKVEARPSIVITTQQDQIRRNVEDQIQECMEMSGADRIDGVGRL